MEAGGGVKVEYHIKPRFAAFGDDMVEPVKLRVALAAVFFEEKLAPERDSDAVRAELRYIFHIFVGDKPLAVALKELPCAVAAEAVAEKRKNLARACVQHLAVPKQLGQRVRKVYPSQEHLLARRGNKAVALSSEPVTLLERP